MTSDKNEDCHVRVDGHIIKKVHELIASKKKIKAIKLVRENSGAGLKEAKLAVDRICNPSLTQNPRLVPKSMIKSIRFQALEGEIEVDIDSMQLYALSNMTSIGVDEVGRILDLCDTLRKWNNYEE